MKYLIIFLVSFNLYALSYTRIDSLTVEKREYQLLNRLNKVCDFSVDPYTCEGGRPTSFAMENELTKLKAELYIEEDARIAEKARITDLRKRFKKIKHSKHKVLGISNPAAWWRDNKSSMNHDDMEALMLAMEASEAQELLNIQATKDLISSKATQKTTDCDKLKKSSAYPAYLKRLFYGKLCN